jgi:hypothetical protein
MPNLVVTSPQRASAAAITAIVAAVAAFLVNPLLGFFLALLAVLLGVVGLVRSLSPRTSGGLMSFGAIFLGLVGIVVQVIHGALRLIF